MKRLISALIFFFPANASFNNESTTPPITPSTPIVQIATGANNQQTPPTVDHRRPANPVPNDMNFAAITRPMSFVQQTQQVPVFNLESTADMLNVPQTLRPSLELISILSALNIYRAQNPTAVLPIVSQFTIGDRIISATAIPQGVNPASFFQLVINQMTNIYGSFINLQQQHAQSPLPNLTWLNFSHQHAQLSLRERAALYLQLQQQRQNNPQ